MHISVKSHHSKAPSPQHLSLALEVQKVHLYWTGDEGLYMTLNTPPSIFGPHFLSPPTSSNARQHVLSF